MNRQDAERIAGKILAIRDSRSKPAIARYNVFMVTSRGSTHCATIEALTLRDACQQHVRAWHSRMTSVAVVMRAPCGRRFSYADSVLEVAK